MGVINRLVFQVKEDKERKYGRRKEVVGMELCCPADSKIEINDSKEMPVKV